MSSKKDAVASDHMLQYVAKATDTDVVKALRNNSKELKKLIKNIPAKKRSYAYAEGKWTIKELLQHIIDAERVFTYRALTFARKDQSPLPGFDENKWAVNANKVKRKWSDVVEELTLLRSTTESFFDSLDEEALLFQGSANNNPTNALAMGYVIAGHAKHHIEIIKERYLK
jgi:hypothetical protein